MELNTAFGLVLQKVRKHKGLTQEDFSNVSSRTYLSTLERGLKSPTIEKVAQLAGVLDVHPATLMLATFIKQNELTDSPSLNQRIQEELNQLGIGS
ncbi:MULTISPECIES: helix-turn-helix domain-containing protein [unclassified Pseudomonas]|uniref:helix-turn-helix domain-containing protein n=1 Tax=unclassified Pseudomonas TaxID=196821 RepID=UPI0021BA9096|nr:MULTISPECIES: helix-turn-helix transcriptional regulator [unclassified Pseudomonas]MCT8166765.1 helix-turn-helix domain-containing protein [Pseudomonas sp. HD6422]MCT8185686.1 helix-turn-helix domain-containing protein [Pseudomonas sp. HD6421]